MTLGLVSAGIFWFSLIYQLKRTQYARGQSVYDHSKKRANFILQHTWRRIWNLKKQQADEKAQEIQPFKTQSSSKKANSVQINKVPAKPDPLSKSKKIKKLREKKLKNYNSYRQWIIFKKNKRQERKQEKEKRQEKEKKENKQDSLYVKKSENSSKLNANGLKPPILRAVAIDRKKNSSYQTPDISDERSSDQMPLSDVQIQLEVQENDGMILKVLETKMEPRKYNPFKLTKKC